MADQAITALPKKTSSGIAATDYLLGIDSAEGYQMLIKDLGDYIIQNVTSSLNGSNQTLAAALSALNSKLGGNQISRYAAFKTLFDSMTTSANGLLGISGTTASALTDGLVTTSFRGVYSKTDASTIDILGVDGSGTVFGGRISLGDEGGSPTSFQRYAKQADVLPSAVQIDASSSATFSVSGSTGYIFLKIIRGDKMAPCIFVADPQHVTQIVGSNANIVVTVSSGTITVQNNGAYAVYVYATK